VEIEGMFPKDCIMWCDSAEPDRIQMFKKAGYYAKPVQKSVNRQANSLIGVTAKTYTLSQIEWFKLHEVIVHSDCRHLIKELKTWQYKQDRLTGEWLDEPEDIGEDAIKAMLYGCNGWMNQRRSIYD
jgi:phage terminase large subunit